MVKLLLAHFANPHALTANQLLPRDLARDPQIIKDLENAEETFLGEIDASSRAFMTSQQSFE